MHEWHGVARMLRLGWPRGHGRRSSGQGYIEYAVILLLVVVVLVVLLIFIGPQIASMFQGIENNL